MRKLLIVDDSQDLLDAMQFFLEKKGFHVKTVASSHNIFSEISEYEPDLIILDVFIHGKDSRQTCRELRKNHISKYLCIMLFSSSPTALENHLDHGADACLEKPFGLNNLLTKIETVLHTCKDNKPI